MCNKVALELSFKELLLTKNALYAAVAHFQSYQGAFLFSIACRLQTFSLLDDHELTLIVQALDNAVGHAGSLAGSLRCLSAKIQDAIAQYQSCMLDVFSELYNLPSSPLLS